MSVTLGESRRAIARPVVDAARGVSASGAVAAGTFAAAAAWGIVAVLRERLFLFGRYNLGNITQAVWDTAHGHVLQVTEVGGAEVSRLGIHVDPIIVLFAPLWWIWPSPQLLLVVQAVALALGALPLFWLGRKHLPRERDAAFVAIAYLLCPTVAWNAVLEFSVVAFAVPLLLFAIWYLDEKRWLAFALAAGAAMLCQEQVGLIVGCLGLWYAWRQRQLRAGLTIAAAGFLISVLDFVVILRHFSGGSPFSARYGGSATGIVRDLFTHPLALGRQLNQYDLLGLLPALPVIGLCFGSTVMFAAAPQIVLLLLSRRVGDWNWFGGNELVLMPFIYAATVFTLARLGQGSSKKKPVFLAGYVLTFSLGIAIFFGPLGAGAIGTFRNHSLAAQRQALSLIPAGAPVSATTHLSVALAARRHLDVFPVLERAEWTLVDARDPWLPDMSFIRRRAGISIGVNDLYWEPRRMRQELRLLRRSPRWRLVYERDGIYLFRRRASTS